MDKTSKTSKPGQPVYKTLHSKVSDYQSVKIIQHRTYGRSLVLDRVMQASERDHFTYHEMLAHVPIFAHGNVKRVLIIGGGDGGMAYEVLKHKSIEQVTMIELDKEVVEAARTYLPMINRGAFDDPRLELMFRDGALFLQENKERYDVIIVDSTDPRGPGEVLFSKAFFQDAARSLTDDGIFVNQSGIPFLLETTLTRTLQGLRPILKDTSCYLSTVPIYAGGQMAFGWGSHSTKHRQIPLEVLKERHAAAKLDLRYYTPEVHKAAFVLPRYIEEFVEH